MENLTKQQIVLLTLLISFITSIATGIVTVALMNQAPVGVVQTINRVVEKTIQTVTTPAKEVQTVVKQTVTVNPDDQIVSAIEENSQSVVRIYRTNTDPTSQSNPTIFVGIGAVVTDDGLVATDNSLISDGGKYFTTSAKGDLIDLSIVRSITGEQIALLKINDDKNLSGFSKASVSSDNLKLGQTVVYIGGETKNTVATGIVSSLSTKDVKIDDTSTSTKTVISSIETSINTNFIPGGLLLDLSGELVGIKSTYMDSAKTELFAPVTDLQDTISSLATSSQSSQ